jgi:TPR repeat protein
MSSGPSRSRFVYAPSKLVVWLVVAGVIAYSARQLIVAGARNLDPALGGAIGILALSLMGFAFLAALFIRFRRFFNKRAVQTDRDAFASQLLPHLIAPGETKAPFSLFLRPFFTDARFRLVHTSQSNPEHIRWGATSGMESSLAIALDRVATLVAAGAQDRRWSFGPGRLIIPDSNWQWAIETLCAHAQYIIAVPLSQPATAWEIAFLREQGHFGKTVFFVPPLNTALRGWFKGSQTRNLRDAYEQSRREFAEQGMTLPAMPDGGGLFRLSADGATVVSIAPLPERGLLPENVAVALDAVLGDQTFATALAAPPHHTYDTQSAPLSAPPQSDAGAPTGPPHTYPTSSFAAPRWWHMGHVQGAIGVASVIEQISDQEWSSTSANVLLSEISDADAIDGLAPLARRENVRATVLLAAAHYFGLAGVNQDHAEAARLANLAAEASDPRGQVILALCYLNGHGVAANRDRAIELLEQAAATGNAFGQLNLATSLDFQDATNAIDPLRATSLYIAAADQGEPVSAGLACHRLIVGIGATEDPSRARPYCRVAADAGLAMGLRNLSVLYRYGIGGVSMNVAEANRLDAAANANSE